MSDALEKSSQTGEDSKGQEVHNSAQNQQLTANNESSKSIEKELSKESSNDSNGTAKVSDNNKQNNKLDNKPDDVTGRFKFTRVWALSKSPG